MQTCPDCGARNEDGELFCGACGTYLEWEEQQSTPPTAQVAEAEQVTEPALEQAAEPQTEQPTQAEQPTQTEQVGAPARAQTDAAGKNGTDAPRAERPSTPTARSPEAAVPEAAVPDPDEQATATTATSAKAAKAARATKATGAAKRAKATGAATAAASSAQRSVAPVKPSAPAPVKPAAHVPAPVKPAAAKPRRYVPPTAGEEPPPAPGDLICGACGAGNAPHRNFCRRCGASLADAPTQGRDGWWRRWRARRKARKEGPKAGTRPKRRRRRRFPTKTVVLLVILGLLGGTGWHYRDDVRTGYNTVLDRINGDNPINPSEVTASSSARNRGPDLARDGISDRSWAPEVTGDGAG